MKKSDFTICNVSRRISRRRRRLHIAAITGQNYILCMVYRNLKNNKKYHALITLRKFQVRSINFNMNAYSHEQHEGLSV